MVVFARDPDVAEQQLNAIIYYLTTFGYIDGAFSPPEKHFIRDFIRHLVAARVTQEGHRDPATGRRRAAELTTHFDMVLDLVDDDIRSLFAEPVATDEELVRFVGAKLKLRCFELFKAFEPANQRTLLDTVDRLIHADGAEHPAEKVFREELVALLSVEPPPTAPVAPAAPPAGPPLEIRPPVAMPVAMEDHPLLMHLERHLPGDPTRLRQQAHAELELVHQAMATWDEQRKVATGHLEGWSSVTELAGARPFLDRYVHVLMPDAGRDLELIVLGDLHGCYSCLKAALLQSGFFAKVKSYRDNPAGNPEPKLVLLGDYVDRGRYSFDGVLRTVLQLLVSMPQHVYVLRGNHEHYLQAGDRVLPAVRPAEAIGSAQDVVPPELLLGYRQLFEAMPCMLLFDQILFVHAGIPRDETTAARWVDLGSLNDEQVRFQMMWSDPSRAEYVPHELQRSNARFPFGRRQFREFMARVGATVLVRGHEKVAEGFKVVYDSDGLLLLNLFSAGGAANGDLPPDSSYRAVTPMALTIRWRDGRAVATPWALDWARFNRPERNGFYRSPPELPFHE